MKFVAHFYGILENPMLNYLDIEMVAVICQD